MQCADYGFGVCCETSQSSKPVMYSRQRSQPALRPKEHKSLRWKHSVCFAVVQSRFCKSLRCHRCFRRNTEMDNSLGHRYVRELPSTGDLLVVSRGPDHALLPLLNHFPHGPPNPLGDPSSKNSYRSAPRYYFQHVGFNGQKEENRKPSSAELGLEK